MYTKSEYIFFCYCCRVTRLVNDRWIMIILRCLADAIVNKKYYRNRLYYYHCSILTSLTQTNKTKMYFTDVILMDRSELATLNCDAAPPRSIWSFIKMNNVHWRIFRSHSVSGVTVWICSISIIKPSHFRCWISYATIHEAIS